MERKTMKISQDVLKKLIAAIVVIMFLFEPFFQILMQTGKVEAATKTYTCYYGDTQPLLAADEEIKSKRIEYQYEIEYEKVLKEIPLKKGNVFQSDSEIVGNYKTNDYGRGIVNNVINYKVERTSKWTTDLLLNTTATGTLTINFKYTSDWVTNGNKSASDFNNINVSLNPSNSINHGNYIKTSVSPKRIITKKYRTIYEVGKKTASGSAASTLVSSSTNALLNKYKDLVTSAQQSSNSSSTNTTVSTTPGGTTTTTPSTPGGTTTTTPSPSTSGTTTTTTTTPSTSSVKLLAASDHSDLNDNARRMYIRNLYKRVLKREPTNSEIDGHFRNNSQKHARDIILSKEADMKSKISSMTNEQFVEACYQYLFGRQADEGGKNSWTRWLSNGNSRENLINALVVSEEFKIKNNLEVTTISSITNETTCDAVYKTLRDNGFAVIKPTNTTILMYKNDITKVTSLDLSGKGITDISGLKVFTNLKKLSLGDNKITNLSKIADVTSLEEISLNNNKTLTDISGIANLSKLKKIEIDNCSVKNFNFSFSKLTSLQEIHADNNALDNNGIAGIANATSIQKLHLNNNKITSLAALTKLTKLKELSADNNNINYVSTLENIEKISIKNNETSITSTKGQADFPDILVSAKKQNSKLYTANNLECTNCTVENNKIIVDDLSKVATVTVKGGNANLTKVTVNSNETKIEITDKVLAEKLEKELEITKKELKSGKFTMYVPTKNITSKKVLDLSNKTDSEEKIKDISGLEKLTELTYINLSNNEVKNLEVLSALTNLKSLEIRFNNLTNLNAIKNIKSLEQLDASNNNITDISGIEDLTNLYDILLSNNNIGDNLEPLSKIGTFGTLVFTNNNIKNVNSLKGIKADNLYLACNKINDITAIKNEEIKNLDLEKNETTVDITGSVAELPAIVKTAIESGANNILCSGCKIENNKIILEEGQKVGKIKVNSGVLSDSIITIQNVEEIKPPVLRFESQVVQKDHAEAKIISDKPIKPIPGWYIDETQTVLTTTFAYCDIPNQKVTVEDLYGNKSSITISCTGITDMDYIPNLRVEYSTVELTNKSVTVTFRADVELLETTNYWGDWKHVDGDLNAISHTFTENEMRVRVSIACKATNAAQGSQIPVYLDILNIDKEAPTCVIEYSTKEKIKGSVRVTIWADEEIKLKGSDNYTKVQKSDNTGKIQYGVQLYYSENCDETVEIEDLAGNTRSVPIKIENIDKTVDGIYTQTSTTNATINPVKMRIVANEKIRLTSSKAIANKKEIYTGRFNFTDMQIDEALGRVRTREYFKRKCYVSSCKQRKHFINWRKLYITIIQNGRK